MRICHEINNSEPWAPIWREFCTQISQCTSTTALHNPLQKFASKTKVKNFTSLLFVSRASNSLTREALHIHLKCCCINHFRLPHRTAHVRTNDILCIKHVSTVEASWEWLSEGTLYSLRERRNKLSASNKIEILKQIIGSKNKAILNKSIRTN